MAEPNEAEQLEKLMKQYAEEEAVMLAEEEALLKEEELLRELDSNPDMLQELNPSFFEKLQNNEEANNLQKLIDDNKSSGQNAQGAQLEQQMQSMMKTHVQQRRKEIQSQKKDLESQQMQKYMEQEKAAEDAKKRLQEQMIARKKEIEKKKQAGRRYANAEIH